MKKKPLPRPLLKASRRLRRQSTRAERLLWARLRNRQMDGAKFRRQAVIGPYIVDFCCPARRVVIELDGAAHDGPGAVYYCGLRGSTNGRTMKRYKATRTTITALLAALAMMGCAGQGQQAAPPTGVAAPAQATPSQQPPTPAEAPGDTAPLSLAWSAETGGAVNQPPLPMGDVVIVTPTGGPLTALDAATGAVRWQLAPDEGQVHPGSYAGGAGTVYVGLSGGRLAALDAATGERLWERSVAGEVTHRALVDGDRLYVPTSFVGAGTPNDPSRRAALYVMDAADGRDLWTFESDNYILQTPFREGDRLYVGGNYFDPTPVDEGGHARIYALSAADGSVRWTYESEDGFPKSVYASPSAVAFIGYQDFASGLDAASGELLWRRDTGNWVPRLSGAGDVIYFGSANTLVHALDIDSGQPVWQHNISAGTFNYVLDAPVIADGALLFLTQHGDIVSLDAGDGSLRWSLPTGIESRAGLSVAQGRVYAGDMQGRVYGFEMADR